MSRLSDFSEEDRETLISLPYRLGVWISDAEDEEGDLDDEKEMKALKHSILAIAKLNEGSPFVQELTRETIRARERWDEWYGESFTATKDLKRLVPSLRSQLGEGEYKAFRKAIMEIAKTVAEAYGEFGDWDDEDEEGFLSGLMSKVTSRFSVLSDGDSNHPMNISPGEQSALSELANILRVD